ncbi:DUF1858 domain-containing protein [Streptococcus panodentis]|uniref:DUF1858 domain-containing protein n=1 Tax=Streptococcus panodentis TaxID=1581472 RepID=A0ABS5AY93_9STRE|nr:MULTISPECIES: DUF1858 domain-containing protein [Streptococcus]MBP2621549.1 hypothetical protein [Streptococcus panodentis]
MNNVIDLSIPVAEVIDAHPEVLDILVELGFAPLANPQMRETVGRQVSLLQGAAMHGLPIEKIQSLLEANGYEVAGID